MYFVGKTLDDLLQKIFPKLLDKGEHISPSRRPANEISGVLFKLTNPRARLSRSETRGNHLAALVSSCGI
jgi:thymidylate synthase